MTGFKQSDTCGNEPTPGGRKPRNLASLTLKKHFSKTFMIGKKKKGVVENLKTIVKTVKRTKVTENSVNTL